LIRAFEKGCEISSFKHHQGINMRIQLRELALSGLMVASLGSAAFAGESQKTSPNACGAKSGCKGHDKTAKDKASCKAAASCKGEKAKSQDSVAQKSACKSAASCKGQSDSTSAGCSGKNGCGGVQKP
jgi:flavodoxin